MLPLLLVAMTPAADPPADTAKGDEAIHKYLAAEVKRLSERFLDGAKTKAEWEAKPVGFVSYGLSLAGGVRAVEHLRQIFAEFHAVGMKDAVLFPRILEHYDAQGRFPAEPEGAEAAAKLLLDQLLWWARALRDAKSVRPYGS